jgi:hypothetical protein
MRRLANVLRKGIAATAAAIVIAASVLVPLLDAGPAATVAHIEQPDGNGCVQYEHDHFACQLFQANPLGTELAARTAFAERVAAADALPVPTRSILQARPATTRSRAPPRA